MSFELAPYIPTDPLESARWSRLVSYWVATRPAEEAAQALLFAHPEGPTLERLRELLADEPEAMAEDLALLAWEALDLDEVAEARPHWEAARALAPQIPEVRILDAVLTLEGEARVAQLEELATELRANLDETSLQALDAGEGLEDIPVLRLHRCQRELAYTLGELDRPEEVVALAVETFSESGADPFGLFPLFVHAALQTEDLEALDMWTAKMGVDSPALMHWLQTYLLQTADQPGAAFQSLRRARKAAPGVELTLLAWEKLVATVDESHEFPDLPYPKDPTSAATLHILGPELASTPTFTAWLRKMRSMK